ncbi:retrovirus-related pol polyprotein from transposon TNT 1-94 [Tanacetum coccineum]
MTMPKMQLNSKVVNNMLLEWGRFMTAVNLNRGLKTSNYDQLYAYLKQYEAHANENRMMLERYNQHAIDTLAFVSNVLAQQYPTQLSAILQSTYVPPNRGQGNNARGAVAAGNQGFQNRVGNANPGQVKPIKCYNCNEIGHIVRQCTHQKRQQNSEYFKDKMLLMQAQENGVVLDEEQLLFIAGGQTNTFDDDVDEAPVQDLAFNEDHVFQANQCDAFDSDVDEAPTAQTMFKASPSYDSDILSEVQDHDNYLDSVDEYQEVHKMHNDVQQNYVVDSDAEYTSDSNIILYDQYVKNNAKQVIQSNVSSVPNDALMMIINDMHDQTALRCSSNKISLFKQFTCYSTLYNGHEIVKTNHAPAVVHDSEDTLEIAEKTRKKMLEKMKSPLYLTPEQIFWSLDILIPKPISEITVYPPNTPAKLVPRVIPTKSQVKINIYTLTQLFMEFDKTCKKRITPCGLIEGERGFEQTKECYLTEVIPFFKTLKEYFEGIQTDLVKESKEMKETFEQMEAEIEQMKEQISHMNERRSEADRTLDFKALDSQNIELTEHATTLQEQNEHFRVENEKVKQHYKELYDSIKIMRAKNIEKTTSLLTENEKLKARLKGKMKCVTMNVVKPKVHASDLEIVKEARIEKPLDNTLESACLYTKRSQELLEYVIGTCPKEFRKREKKVATTTLNRKKQVTFREPCETSNNNTQTHVKQQKVQKTNVPVIPSIGVNSSTEASGSKPRSNT